MKKSVFRAPMQIAYNGWKTQKKIKLATQPPLFLTVHFGSNILIKLVINLTYSLKVLPHCDNMEILHFHFNLIPILLFFSILFIVVRKWKEMNQRLLPPGPWKLPIIGSIHHLIITFLEIYPKNMDL